MSQSLLRQRLLPDLFDPRPGKSDALVSIASSSAITSGLTEGGRRFVEHILSQSLLRQRLLPDILQRRRATRKACCLNRFFVSDYFRTRSDGSRPHGPLEVSIASSSAITSGRGAGDGYDSVR